LRTYPKDVKALAHITGGGLTENLPRVLPAKLGAEISASSWKLPPVFRWLQEAGNVPQDDMYRTFNCGIGMVLIVDASKATAVFEAISAAGESACRIGTTFSVKDGQPQVVTQGSLALT